MNLEDRLVELATTLLERSRKNEVKWEKAEREGGYPYNRVAFPTSEFQIWYMPSPTEPDSIGASIDKRGGIEVVRLDATAEDGSPHWQLLSDLYEESNRCILGWDKVLSEIEEELKKDVVGQHPNPPTTLPPIARATRS
jgi:hypothetical protein